MPNDAERLKAARLAKRLSQAKAGMRYGYTFAKVHPSLTPEERDLIVRALTEYALAKKLPLDDREHGVVDAIVGMDNESV